MEDRFQSTETRKDLMQRPVDTFAIAAHMPFYHHHAVVRESHTIDGTLVHLLWN